MASSIPADLVARATAGEAAAIDGLLALARGDLRRYARRARALLREYLTR